ncbi:MAG TPA: multicopper oxidase domain-containing protein [Acidimicrobiia bacterium]|nr:multicopper oxidase domain-containing protein [Acidimicrobiia bacterium]
MRQGKSDPKGYGLSAAAFAFIAVVVAMGALITAGQAWSRANDAKANGGSGSAVSVTLQEFSIQPAAISVPVGGSIHVTNAGKVVHNFTITNTKLKTKDLSPGDSATLDLASLKAGSYEAYCAVPGHKDAGMKATVTVGGSASSASGSMAGMDMSSGTASLPTMKQINDADAQMAAPTKKFVSQLKGGPNTKGVGNQVLEPKILADGTKEFDITAKVTDWEVSPGHTVKAWTYNGMVPGPMIHVNVGDKVRIALTNKLPQSTVIHLHGIELPNAMDGVPDITQPPVKPDATFNYDFVARAPAVGMYHSHDFASTQVPDGLFAPFLVGEMPVPSGVTVSQELPMVLNDAGVIGLTLNGKSFPATAPVIAKPGDWVEVHYFNEGLMIHPMHLHGMPQLVIAKDGYPLPAPYQADTVLVGPGERYTVLVHATEPGVWAWHCHILTHAETDQGMFGMVTAFIVQ